MVSVIYYSFLMNRLLDYFHFSRQYPVFIIHMSIFFTMYVSGGIMGL